MERYYKVKGWNGKVYRMRMSEEEIRDRRYLAVVLCTVFSLVAFIGGWILGMSM